MRNINAKGSKTYWTEAQARNLSHLPILYKPGSPGFFYSFSIIISTTHSSYPFVFRILSIIN